MNSESGTPLQTHKTYITFHRSRLKVRGGNFILQRWTRRGREEIIKAHIEHAYMFYVLLDFGLLFLVGVGQSRGIGRCFQHDLRLTKSTSRDPIYSLSFSHSSRFWESESVTMVAPSGLIAKYNTRLVRPINEATIFSVEYFQMQI